MELTFGGNFVLDKMGRWLARRSLKWYERHAAWVFPALDIRARLRARKCGRSRVDDFLHGFEESPGVPVSIE